MSCPPVPIALFFLVLSLTGVARAHQVPNMTIEAEFGSDQSYTLRINLDPRVFLSDQPTSLPPVPASWLEEQTPAEVAETRQRAQEYLAANVALQFGEQPVPLPACEIVPMDGATNAAPTADTAELHLLATAKGTRPKPGGPFQLNFGRDANVSLILLNSLDGQLERRPQVLFPGESSRPFLLPAPPPTPERIAAPANVAAGTPGKQRWPVMGMSVALLAVLALGFLLRRRKRRARP